jgi:lipopolysaccharide/colanic/teichoic acid biosynthesis glycosyltransferase
MKVEGKYYFEAIPEYWWRHRVRPGITGWAQINGSRGEVATLEEARRRLELDFYYITHWSLWLDLLILIRTIRLSVVVSGY